MNKSEAIRETGWLFYAFENTDKAAYFAAAMWHSRYSIKMQNPMQPNVSQRSMRSFAIRGLLLLFPVVLFSACIKYTIPIPPPPGSGSTTSGDTSKGSADTSYSVLWNTTVTGADQTTGFIQTSDGGFVSAGQTPGQANVFRLDASRNVLWQKNLGGSAASGAWSVAATSDGGFVAVGFTDATDGDATDNHGGRDGWVYKLDANGNLVWKHCMGGTSDDQFFSVLVNSDGTIMAAGQTNSNDDDVSGSHGGADLWLVKLDASGNKLWSKCYGGSSDDLTGTVNTTSDGGYILTGSSGSKDGDIPGNYGGDDIVVLKLDANGNKQWANHYGGPDEEENSATIINPDGSIVIVSSTAAGGNDVTGFHGAGGWDIWVLKLTSSGTKVWATACGTDYNEKGMGLTATTGGGYMVSGYTDSYDLNPMLNGGRDAWLVKLSAGGSQVWQQIYGPGGNANVISEWLITAKDGGIVSGGSDGTNATLFKVN